MDDLSREEFNKMKQDAERRLLQMNRSDMPPFPSFVKVPPKNPPPTVEQKSVEASPPSAREKQTKGRFGSFLKYLDISKMLENSDSVLLLSLMLLLSSEDADEALILALAYILL